MLGVVNKIVISLDLVKCLAYKCCYGWLFHFGFLLKEISYRVRRAAALLRRRSALLFTLRSAFDADAYSFGLKISKVIPVESNVILIPELSAAYSTYEQPRIVEVGSGDLLIVDRTDSQSLPMRIGGKAVKVWNFNKDQHVANIYLGAWYEFDPYLTRESERSVSAQSTQSSVVSAVSKSQAVPAQKFNIEVGSALQISENLQVSLNGGFGLADSFSSSYVMGGMIWAF